MTDKLTYFTLDREYLNLCDQSRSYIISLDAKWRFTVQELRQLITISKDLELWDEGTLDDLWLNTPFEGTNQKQEKKKRFTQCYKKWLALKEGEKSYENFNPQLKKAPSLGFKTINDNRNILGSCPVASEKTRCCNLKTLDAVINCGFDCSYCSIQSFYHDNKILEHDNLVEKLKNLDLDPQQKYHIGTGQSSDSLMWGNHNGLLDHLMDFAFQNPNVILEFKTKSDNISYFINRDSLPPNILLTWSLNTTTIIKNEERFTSSLNQRIQAAKDCADKGIPIGFHFHPMVLYKGWEKEYISIAQTLTDLFKPEEIVTLSMGTLTFIKPVLKELRQRSVRSKILQMPLVDAAGKLSYPLDDKIKMFKTLYDAFLPWHKDVFFYLCMEDKEIWEPVFGHSYKDNTEFEKDMLYTYDKKMKNLRK